ncbi:MAG: HD domain-containing protein [Lachnospiraceae bacterium]|nr:HD domain-containing protein [Lachnospiraceae bacterium]
MKYLEDLQEGSAVQDIYLVKNVQNMVTKAGKPYISLLVQDKTGTVDGKVWEVDSPGIEEFSSLDYVFLGGDVTLFNGGLQINVKRAKKASEGEYDPMDYLPVSEKNVEEMYAELLSLVDSVKEPHYNSLLCSFFKDDEKFKKKFCFTSAAKSVHHNYVGGLLEHTLSVTQLCDFYATHYPMLDRDLLITAAICHDIGKIKELSPYPENDYTDEGQLLGHIIIGTEMVSNRIAKIEGFPPIKARELLHCILAHHGELEYGSPKKPALIEAVALSFADNTDAKMETFRLALKTVPKEDFNFQGFNRYIESNIRRTSVSQSGE